jgi:hypothetical protein
MCCALKWTRYLLEQITLHRKGNPQEWIKHSHLSSTLLKKLTYKSFVQFLSRSEVCVMLSMWMNAKQTMISYQNKLKMESIPKKLKWGRQATVWLDLLVRPAPILFLHVNCKNPFLHTNNAKALEQLMTNLLLNTITTQKSELAPFKDKYLQFQVNVKTTHLMRENLQMHRLCSTINTELLVLILII